MRKTRLMGAFAFASLLFAFTACASFPGLARLSPQLPSDPAITSGALGNGMKWFVAHNGEPANRLFLKLVVNAGSSLEDDDQKGLAHLIEHMAFNGTEHFKKNELVDYFESIGMSFGPEVNAYTSFDETVYELEIPADDPAMLEKALLVLRDWACAISFDQDELDKERGVVIEEWRQGRGASGRVLDAEYPFLLSGSRFASRLPIGDPEIVRTATRERVTDFYKKWYRPDLMSVIIVGDADPVMLSRRVETVLGSVPAALKKDARPIWSAPVREKDGVLVVRDPELPYTTVQLLEQHPADSFRTEADLRARLVRSIAFSAFNARLSEKKLVADPLVLAATSGVRRIVRPSAFTYSFIIPSTGKFDSALGLLFTELARYEKYGITAGELGRAKQSLLDNIHQVWLDRAKLASADLAEDVSHSVLYGETSLSIQAQYDLYNRIIPEISAKEVEDAIRLWYSGKGKMLLVTANDSATDIPSEDVLLSMWQAWKAPADLAPYAENDLDRPLFSDSPARGRIVKEESVSANGIQQWTLSNGARVLVYPTKFKDNEILFSAWSKGGSSAVADSDYPSAAVADSFAQMSGLNGFSATDLKKKLSGKTVSVHPWIDEAWEGLYGSSSAADFETLLQLANLEFTKPSFSADAWQALHAQLQTVAASRLKDPSEMFADLGVRLLYGNSQRRSNLTGELVAAMDGKKSAAAYEGRFADAGDFTFAFVGNIDEAKLRDLAELYLASLPSSGKREEAKALAIPFPAGISKGSINMGVEPKADVMVAFGGPAVISGDDREMFDMMCQVLEIRLREVIREDMSGSYGVGVSGSLTDYPESRYEIRIEFGCDPSRVDELSKAVLDQIRWMQGAPVDAKYITKVRETFRRSREEGLKNNDWWLREIAARSMSGRSLDGIADTAGVLSGLSGERLQSMASTYFKKDNYVIATLLPKK